MPFYRTGEPGVDAYVHLNLGRRRLEPPPCQAAALEGDSQAISRKCLRISVALCDGPAGEDLAGHALTCDMPLCERHRTEIGPNRDVCPRCAAKMRAAGLLVDGLTT